MVDIEQAFNQKFPDFLRSESVWVKKPLMGFIRFMFMEAEINQFLAENNHLSGLSFVDRVLEYFDLAYSVSSKKKENIPSNGRALIVANHPLGALDALALIQLVSEIRSDIKVVAADYLLQLEPLQTLLLPIDNLSKNPGKENVKHILAALEDEQLVIVFPAKEVSRARPRGVRDTKWLPGFIHFAQKTQSPIIPVYIEGRNSRLFYSVSALSKPLSSLLLVREMFKQRSRTLHIRVGEKISAESISGTPISPKVQASLVKRHLYRIGTRRKSVFKTEQAIALPEPPKSIKSELRLAETLGTTTDGKHIYLIDPKVSPTVLREIGRLRETSFRRVGEGTGQRRDVDRYDRYYRQIILWDEQDLEVVGAYRIGEGKQILDAHGLTGFYVNSLFKLLPEFTEYAEKGIELGRSFVQPKYWGSRALDYLWQGIGAYLAKNREVQWMFGPVSISNNYPKGAKDLLVYFYQRFFGGSNLIARCRNPYPISESDIGQLNRIFCGTDYSSNFRILKDQLAHYELSVPTLFKQYTELYEDGGVGFYGFNVDPNFSQCIDGFILSDLTKLKASKFDRYIGRNLDNAPFNQLPTNKTSSETRDQDRASIKKSVTQN